jgi:ornithine carbamoyltransferase
MRARHRIGNLDGIPGIDEYFANFGISNESMKFAKPDAIVMHCLPAHRGEEITADVLDGPQSVIIDQAENRLHMQKAILSHLLSRKKGAR